MKFIGIFSTVVTLVAAWAPYYHSDIGGDSDSDVVVHFVAIEGEEFADIFDSIVASNDEQDVTEFLELQLSSGIPAADDLGLSNLSESVAEEILIDAVEAVAEGGEGRSSELSSLSTSTVILSSMEWDSRAQTAGLVPRTSVSTAPVAGEAANNRFSWRFKDRAYLATCSLTCTSKSWLDYELLTDPGREGTRTTVKFAAGGEGKLHSVKLRTVVLSNGTNISDVTNNWSSPVSGKYQWNTPHSSTTGKTFQMYYVLEFIGTGVSAKSYEYKSKVSAKCTTPKGAAFRCLFP